MKLRTITQLSVDAVMQAPGTNLAEGDDDMSDRRGWAHFDDEAGSAMNEFFERAGAFLFGRRTFDHFASTWGAWDDPGDSPIWTALHTLPKYVVSASRASPLWAGTTVISGDVETAVRDLKAEPGRELQVHGSGALFRWLLDRDLIDEMTLFTFPVVVGQGTRLFPATGPDASLELVASRITTSGVMIQSYRFIGARPPA
ncbi:MAG TPA: dihydrofolate reductase family protein [Candidatus Limnocylindrales bacterium]|nr:dihydrofolate reductase family protein [Candidatus Limnocylindrales bacterium]